MTTLLFLLGFISYCFLGIVVIGLLIRLSSKIEDVSSSVSDLENWQLFSTILFWPFFGILIILTLLVNNIKIRLTKFRLRNIIVNLMHYFSGHKY